jgi:hypothetical protein
VFRRCSSGWYGDGFLFCFIVFFWFCPPIFSLLLFFSPFAAFYPLINPFHAGYTMKGEVFRSFMTDMAAEADTIGEERKAELLEIARKIRGEDEVDLVFICTHNSRRSQLGEVLAKVFCADLGISKVKAFSGGIEGTAFDERMVKALREVVGVDLAVVEAGSNPKYSLNGDTQMLFSKEYNHPANPSKGFMALMVCGHADENCPIVRGKKFRVSFRFSDPKEFDGTEKESEAYRAKVREMGREIYFFLKHSI